MSQDYHIQNANTEYYITSSEQAGDIAETAYGASTDVPEHSVSPTTCYGCLLTPSIEVNS